MYTKPTIINGNTAVDDRGDIIFANDFNFDGVKRFYAVRNHEQNFIRAWHGHKKEAKYCLVTKGTFIVGAVEITNWDAPSQDTELHKFILSSTKPSVLYIPPGYANGLKNLTSDAQIMFFSTATLEEAKTDDFRFPYNYWDIWNIDYR